MSLTGRIGLLALCLSVVPLAVLGAFVARVTQDYFAQEVHSDLALHTEQAQAQLERWVRGNGRHLESLAQRPLVIEHLGALFGGAGSGRTQQLRQALRANHLLPALEERGGFEKLSLLHPENGEILVGTTPGDEGLWRESTEFFLRGREGTYVGQPQYELAEDALVMHLATPVRTDTGRLVGVLAAHLDWNEMSQILKVGWGLTASRESYLVNRFQFRITESRFEGVGPFRRAVRTEGVNACVTGESGTGEYLDYRGVPVVGVYQWMDEWQMCLVTEQDQAEAYALVSNLRRIIWIATGVTVLLATAVGLAFARALTRPLRELQDGVRRLGRGDGNFRLWARGRHEVAELARAFNATIDALQQSTASREELGKEVAERRRVEQQLREKSADLRRSNAELEQFAYVASHDLQEPLRMVTSYVQLLQRRYAGELDADADEFIHYAVDGASRMKRLINDLLAFSRVGTRGKPLVPVEAGAVLHEALRSLASTIEESGGAVTHDPLPTVLADADQLYLVFLNLVGNAFKFHKPDVPPQVHVSASRQDPEWWLFSVRDNGIGIDPKHLERVFVIFQRLHNKSEFSGTGIGLAQCKKIVERHGGRLWVESEPDRGADFRFTWPADPDVG